jgi:hypothetical protein
VVILQRTELVMIYEFFEGIVIIILVLQNVKGYESNISQKNEKNCLLSILVIVCEIVKTDVNVSI